MNTVEIPEKKIIVEYPSSMDEHTREQHEYVMQQLFLFHQKEISIEEFKIKVLYNFLGIKFTAVTFAKNEKLSEEELENKLGNIWQLTETLNYLFEVEDKTIRFAYYTIKNFLPDIDAGGKKLYGPADAFQNLTFQELLDSMNFFAAYQISKEEENLDKLIAVLYREEIANYQEKKTQLDFDGHQRVKYNPNLVDENAKAISKIPMHIKWAIYLYYSACYNFITSAEVTINNVEIDLSILFKKLEQDDPKLKSEKGIGMIGLLFKLAETGIFGTIEKVSTQNIYDVLLMLYQQKREYDAHIKELNRKKR